MRRFFAIVALLLLGIACDKDEAFTCKVVDSEATDITQTTATLEATINASDFGKVERICKKEALKLPFLSILVS